MAVLESEGVNPPHRRRQCHRRKRGAEAERTVRDRRTPRANHDGREGPAAHECFRIDSTEVRDHDLLETAVQEGFVADPLTAFGNLHTGE
jgi:hypothetical protein